MVRKGSDQPDDPVLRAKYLDWCSARLAERFIRMTPEEIYQLAEQASNDPIGQARAKPRLLSSSEITDATRPDETGASQADAEAQTSFRSLVERVTEALTLELRLPRFDEWSAAYREDPTRFDGDLLGVWREAL